VTSITTTRCYNVELSICQSISCIINYKLFVLMDTWVRHRHCKFPTSDTTLSHINPLHIFTTIFPKFHCNITIPSTRYSKRFLYKKHPNQNYVCITWERLCSSDHYFITVNHVLTFVSCFSLSFTNHSRIVRSVAVTLNYQQWDILLYLTDNVSRNTKNLAVKVGQPAYSIHEGWLYAIIVPSKFQTVCLHSRQL